MKYTALFMGPKIVNLLVNNFTASATGCNNPHSPTLLGPIRDCDKESALRSIKVIKATLTKTTRTPIIYSSIIKIQLILFITLCASLLGGRKTMGARDIKPI